MQCDWWLENLVLQVLLETENAIFSIHVAPYLFTEQSDLSLTKIQWPACIFLYHMFEHLSQWFSPFTFFIIRVALLFSSSLEWFIRSGQPNQFDLLREYTRGCEPKMIQLNAPSAPRNMSDQSQTSNGMPSANEIISDFPHLVRSVPGWVLLSGCSWRFMGYYEQAEDDIPRASPEEALRMTTRGWYNRYYPRLCEQVCTIDTFLSYTGQGSFWDHWFGLVVHFHFQMAFKWTAPFAIIIGSIHGWFDSLGQEFTIYAILRSPVFLCALYFTVILVVGHRLAPSRMPNVFFDRMCISRIDRRSQDLALYSLNEIVARSDNMLVLWSPTYFQRLWCIYEIGTFMKRKRNGSIEVCFPSEARFVLDLFLMLLVSKFEVLLFYSIGWQHTDLKGFGRQVFVQSMFSLRCTFWARSYREHRRKFVASLERFDMTRTEVSEDSDRETIYRNIASLYSASVPQGIYSEEMKGWLEVFKSDLERFVAPYIKKIVGSDTEVFSTKQWLIVFVSSTLPVMVSGWSYYVCRVRRGQPLTADDVAIWMTLFAYGQLPILAIITFVINIIPRSRRSDSALRYYILLVGVYMLPVILNILLVRFSNFMGFWLCKLFGGLCVAVIFAFTAPSWSSIREALRTSVNEEDADTEPLIGELTWLILES